MSPSDPTALGEPAREALVILGAAAIVIPLFHRLRLSPVLGYMLVGLLAGPSGLGALADRRPGCGLVTITDRARIEPVAELGVVLLMFMIGLELSWERHRQHAAAGVRPGRGAGRCSAPPRSAALALALGAPPAPAVVVGLALAMSSTAIVTQVLAERAAASTSLAGRASFAVLLFQDLAVVPILFLLGHARRRGEGGRRRLFWRVGAGAAGVVGAGRRSAGSGCGRCSAAWRGPKSPELFMAACLLVVLATGLAAAAAGLSMALGALIAGLLLAETEYRRQIEVTIEPFKGLLLGVFLISVGLQPGPRRGWRRAPVSVLGAALGLVRLKAALIRCSPGCSGCAGRWRCTALLLGPGGEFGFVILGLGGGQRLLEPGLAGTALLVAALTMAAIPALSRLRPAISRRRRLPAVPARAAAASGRRARRRDHRRLRPGRPHGRRHAGPARDPVRRARQRRARVAARARARARRSITAT